jgi:hypothetical protein
MFFLHSRLFQHNNIAYEKIPGKMCWPIYYTILNTKEMKTDNKMPISYIISVSLALRITSKLRIVPRFDIFEKVSLM